VSLRVPLIHKDIPHFGFDIGTHTIKVVQLHKAGNTHVVQGYGFCYFPVEAVTEGIIADPEAMAKQCGHS
jgi:Tfp pilus assembly PilM family ATPase